MFQGSDWEAMMLQNRLYLAMVAVGECVTKHLTVSITNRQSKDFSLL